MHIDLDGGDTPWFGVEVVTAVGREVQRMTKKAKILAFCVALSKLSGPAEIFRQPRSGALLG